MISSPSCKLFSLDTFSRKCPRHLRQAIRMYVKPTSSGSHRISFSILLLWFPVMKLPYTISPLYQYQVQVAFVLEAIALLAISVHSSCWKLLSKCCRPARRMKAYSKRSDVLQFVFARWCWGKEKWDTSERREGAPNCLPSSYLDGGIGNSIENTGAR